jgi:hypothetical protein
MTERLTADELRLLRDMGVGEENPAKAHRLAVVQKILDIFEDAHGRQAHTMEEISDWFGTPAGKAALAYDLTPDGKIIP